MQTIFQKKALIISIIFFILAGVACLFFYRMVNNHKEASRLAEEKWQAEETRRNSARSLASLLNRVTEEKALIESHFVRSSDVVPFLDTIEKLAGEVKVSAEVTSVNVAKDGASLLVDLKTQGTFENTYKLILLLENSPYILSFVSADIQSSNAESTSGATTTKTSEWTGIFQVRLLSFLKE